MPGLAVFVLWPCLLMPELASSFLSLKMCCCISHLSYKMLRRNERTSKHLFGLDLSNYSQWTQKQLLRQEASREEKLVYTVGESSLRLVTNSY